MSSEFAQRAVSRFKTIEGAVWILWVLTAARTLSYFSERDTVLAHLVENLNTDWLSPLVWGTAWAFITVGVLSKSRRLLSGSIGFTAAVIFLWGVLFLWSHPDAFLSRGSLYIALCAMLTWGIGRTTRFELSEGGSDAVDAAGGRR
ncbi:hypothetical protein [Corynebacterium sp. MC3]|uniref:hypothetical protein n=1 Tax=Corynebacterium sp. MC3 TaxID=1720193 RepID=UPI0008DA4FB4|nr:hypothetical protein [Corynebacterium sp. MC3]